VGLNAGCSVPVAVQKPTVRVPHRIQEKRGGLDGGVLVPGLVEDPSGGRERRNHQSVPVRQDLVVEPRAGTLIPLVQQRGSGLFNRLTESVRAHASTRRLFVERRIQMENILPRSFPRRFLPVVAFGRHVVEIDDQLGRLRIQKIAHLVGRPNVERSLLHVPLFVFTVGVLSRVESPVRRLQVTKNVREHLTGRPCVPGRTGSLVGLRVGHDVHGLIVEHLLEVREQPPFVGGVAVEAVPYLVVNPPEAHPIKRLGRHL